MGAKPAQPGVYEDATHLFAVQFPRAWRIVRTTKHGTVFTVFSAEAGRVPPKQIRVQAELSMVVLSDVFRRQNMTAVAILKHLMSGNAQFDSGLKIAAGVSPAKVGAFEGATCTLQGTLKDRPGEFTEERFLTEKEGVIFQLACTAPKEEYASVRPTFLKIVADSRFGRSSLPRRDSPLGSSEIVRKYKRSVVSIVGDGEGGSWTGSGFIISRDGYILSNYHVAYDMQTRKPAKSLMVQWDESLKRSTVKAELVGAKYKMGAFEQSNYGTDVALLKIPAGDYEPMPLSPLAEINVGDDVITLGFPARGLLEGISLTVTRGVVTRFNRGPDGEVQSIFSDAAFTHGSSGGPCFDLATGGVIGLNSFGQDVHLDPRQAQLNNLIKYHGIVPIDAAIREFPLQCLPGLDSQASDLDFMDSLALSKYLLDVGSANAAEQVALGGVSSEPQQALGYVRLGQCRFQRALNSHNEGDAQGAKAGYDNARRSYERALQRDPRQPDALVAFATLEAQLGRLEEAVDLATRATESNPQEWSGRLLLADILARQSRFDEALKHVAKAKETTAGLIVNPYFTAANIYAAKQDYASARKEWAEAVRISPVYLPARLGIAECFEHSQKPEAAVAEYQRILDDFKENGEVLGRLGLCLLRAGRTDEAVNCLGNSLRRCEAANQPPSEAVLLEFARCLEPNPNAVAEAIRIYGRYLFHYPNAPSAPNVSLKLAAIHAQHQYAGLASAHARLAVRLQQGAQVAQAAQQFPIAPLTVNDITVMAQLPYPLPLALDLIASSPLGFVIQNEAELQQLRQSGLPEEFLKAIVEHAPMPLPSAIGGSALPPVGGWQPPAGQPQGVTPPGGWQPPLSPPGSMNAELLGTWIADGAMADGAPFRCTVIFGNYSAYTTGIMVGARSLGITSGSYRIEQGRLILEPQGGPPVASAFQIQGATLIMDVPNFANGLRFVRQ